VVVFPSGLRDEEVAQDAKQEGSSGKQRIELGLGIGGTCFLLGTGRVIKRGTWHVTRDKLQSTKLKTGALEAGDQSPADGTGEEMPGPGASGVVVMSSGRAGFAPLPFVKKLVEPRLASHSAQDALLIMCSRKMLLRRQDVVRRRLPPATRGFDNGVQHAQRKRGFAKASLPASSQFYLSSLDQRRISKTKTGV
jgi:hypothetical protein